MASYTRMASNNCSTEEDPVRQNGLTEDYSCELHRAAFHGDVDRVRELLETVKLDLKSQDKHGTFDRVRCVQIV